MRNTINYVTPNDILAQIGGTYALLNTLLVLLPISFFMVSGFCLKEPYTASYVIKYLSKKYGTGEEDASIRKTYLESVSHEGIFLMSTKLTKL